MADISAAIGVLLDREELAPAHEASLVRRMCSPIRLGFGWSY
jgi:hypothetical protein